MLSPFYELEVSACLEPLTDVVCILPTRETLCCSGFLTPDPADEDLNGRHSRSGFTVPVMIPPRLAGASNEISRRSFLSFPYDLLNTAVVTVIVKAMVAAAVHTAAATVVTGFPA